MIENKPDILAILMQEGIELRKRGRLWWSCCPFHRERTPSFAVNPDRQSFYCFGCGEKGDVISFIQKIRNLSFKDALIYLNITPGEIPKVDRKVERQQKLKKAYAKWLKDYYRQLCRESVRLHKNRITVQDDPSISEEEAWKFAEDMGKLAEIDHKLDILWEGSPEEKFQLFKEIVR